jgi:PAT family beta-lactamase induction signal transducer AmpG
MITSMLALGVALASATQDIAIDAYRIDTFPKSESSKLPQASAMAVVGWWTGYSLPGYLAFVNADNIGWNGVYYGMATIVALLMLFTLLTREPNTDRIRLQAQAEERHSQIVGSKVVAWFSVTLIEPFADFFRRNGVRVAITLLLFVFLFKIGEAFLGRMSIPFYKEIGFSNEQIGHYSKLIGWGATIFFTIIGSMFNVKFGIVRGLMIGGIAMAASNLMFAWIAQTGPSETLFLATIIVDNFTTAFSTVAFVSFLTVLTGQAFSATQYALLASLGNFGRTTLASFSGELVDYLNDWSLFFIITAVMVIPSLLMLYSLRGYFNDVLEKARKRGLEDEKEFEKTLKVESDSA